MEEQKLLSNNHFQNLRQEVDDMKACLGHLVKLFGSFCKESPEQNQNVAKEACIDKLERNNGTEEDPRETCSLTSCKTRGAHNRMDVTQNKQQQQLAKQEQKPKEEEEGASQEEASEQDRPKQNNNNNSLGTNYIGSLGREEQEAMTLHRILVDTGAETSVAPRSFADHIPLSFSQNDLQLRGADGRSIHILGTREVELVTTGFSFTTSFVICDVEKPLLSLRSLLENNLGLQLDSVKGHQLVNLEGENIQLQQVGHQIFLSACPMELELTSSMIGILQDKSLMPDNKVDEPQTSLELRKHKEMPEKGGATSSFTLENLGHLRQQANKPAIGQQQTLPTKAQKKKNKKLGQGAANKLRPLAKNNSSNEIQLALLHPKQDPTSLDHATAQEISFRIVLTWSLMNKWQLSKVRFDKAKPQEEILGHLRKLGLDQCNLDTLWLGDRLFVMLDRNSLLIGGHDQMQECFITELSAITPLESRQKLEDDNPLTFLDRTVELHQAERSISLQFPLASLQLLEQEGHDEQQPSSLEQLDFAASRWSRNLDAKQSKLYKDQVGSLQRLALSRPDAAFAIHQLRRSLGNPTENDRLQLQKVLGYLRRTQAYITKLQPTRRWNKATSLELLAYASTSSTTAWHASFGVSLFLLGVPLIASSKTQATRVEAAELTSVNLACAMASFTRILLQQLGFQKHVSLKVLTGGSLAKQLGLSKHLRHVQLDSCFGQFELSKVLSHQTFAKQLTYNPPACELHRLLPKLKMHTRAARERALPLCKEGAFFLGPCSFYIGVVSLTPAMEPLDLAELEQTVSNQLTQTASDRQLDQDELERIELNQLDGDKLERIDLDKLERRTLDQLQLPYVSQLWGKEPVEHLNIPELESFQREELVKMPAKTLHKLELDKADSSLDLTALQRIDEIQEQLTASTAKPDEGRRACTLGALAPSSDSAFQLQGRELGINIAHPESEQLHPSGGVSEALARQSSSTKPSRRTLHSLSSTLLFIFIFLMISIFPSKSLENSFDNNFIHCCAFQLVEQDELSTTFGQEELGKQNEFKRTFLWDQELDELLVDKSFPLDPLHGHLGKENLWSVQLQQNLLENDEQKELEDLELEEKNFDKSFQKKIFLKKLDALLLKWHFAKAASHQLVGIKAGEKHREASKEIFDKVGDKELLQEEPRREELGCKDLWPAYLWAFCPTSFEENSFTKKTFANTSLGKETFPESSFTIQSLTRKSLTRKSLTRKSLTRKSLTRKSLTRQSLTRSSLTENSFLENTFLKNTFSKKSFAKKSFDKKSFSKKSFDKKSFSKKSFDKKSFAEQSFAKKTFDKQSFAKNSFDKSSFTKSSLEESSFTKSSFRQSSFRGSSLQQKSFYKSSLEDSSLEESRFTKSSFPTSSLEKSSFQTSSFADSSLQGSSFNQSSFTEHSFTAASFNKSSFEESSFATSSFTEHSFQKSSLEQSSLQAYSFESRSLEAGSFQRASLDSPASTRTASTLELAELERSTFRTELGKLERTAFSTELHNLEAPAWKKEPCALQLCVRGFLLSLGGTQLCTAGPQGGVLRGEAFPSLQLDHKLVPGIMLGSSLPAASLKRKLLPLAFSGFFGVF